LQLQSGVHLFATFAPQDVGMKYYKSFTAALADFRASESGAVTVDWVVLAAAVIGLTVINLTTLGRGITGHADLVDSTMSTRGIPDY